MGGAGVTTVAGEGEVDAEGVGVAEDEAAGEVFAPSEPPVVGDVQAAAKPSAMTARVADRAILETRRVAVLW